MVAALVDFLSALGGQRPVTIAILVILIIVVLLRPRRKPQGGGGTSSGGGAPPQQQPGASVSTADVLLEFCNGAPRLKSDALEPLFRLCARFDVHLVTQLPVDYNGLVNPADLAAALKEKGRDPFLVTIMHSNNETGILQPIQALATAVKDAGVPSLLFHVDASQSTGKVRLDATGVHFMTL